MAPFVCLAWPHSAADAEARANRFETELLAGGDWKIAFQDGCRVYAKVGRSIEVRRLDEWGSVVVGDLFDRGGHAAPDSGLVIGANNDPVKAARRLLAEYWGRYVAIFRGPAGTITGVLRDPCGSGDAAVWSCNALVVATNALPDAVAWGLLPKTGLNWDAVHSLAADPFFAATTSLFNGVTALAPGAVALRTNDGFRLEPCWRPSEFASDPIGGEADVEAALRDRIDRAVAAFAKQPGDILAEVSGGFDSSVVAESLRRAGGAVQGWCHHFTADPSGDERVYAYAVGKQLGVDILCRPRPHADVSPALIARSQFGLRPSAFALDPIYDVEALGVARSVGATRMFTGWGGDGLFYSMPTPTIAKDLLRRRRGGSILGSEAQNLARWSRKSIWTIARAAVFPGQAKAVFQTPSWVAPWRIGSCVQHPWLEDTQRLTPAKRVHIEEQVLAHLMGGSSLRASALDLVHPLFSQPVLELCLRVPVDRLVSGGRDRALARRAFKGRVPDIVNDRRSKGELGLYYGSAIAAGLPAIRGFLLEGCLLQRGVLVRQELEAVLDEAHLAQHGGFSGLLFAVAIEAWVQRWEHQSAIGTR